MWVGNTDEICSGRYLTCIIHEATSEFEFGTVYIEFNGNLSWFIK